MTALDALRQKYRERCIEALDKWTWDNFGDGPDPDRYPEDARVMDLLGGQVDAVLKVIAADMGEKDLIRDEDGVIREWWMVDVYGDEVSA